MGKILDKKKWSINLNIFLKNTFSFAIMMIFILGFMKLFGEENTLVGVCIYVGLIMFAECNTKMRLNSMLIVIFFCFVGSVLASNLNIYLPLEVAFVLNFIFVFIVMLLTSEPTYLKLNIIMLLLFLFCQSVPVSKTQFNTRLAGTIIGTLLIMGYTYYHWKKKGYGGSDSKTLKEQIIAGWKYKSVCFRMAFGVSLSIILTGYYGSIKPLWISLVVLSLTQFSTEDMVSRIKHRVLGTILGAVFFVVVFTYLIPIKYGIIVILLLGYLGYYFNEYKHKQFINAVSAINASLVLFDSSATSAIYTRFESLFIGILIVLILFVVEVGFSFFKKEKV